MRFSPDDAQRIDALLRWRRDVRHFRPDPIPEAEIAALEAAMALGPSVGASQPWRVLRLDSPEIRAGAIACFERANAEALDAYEGDRRAAYARLKLSGMREAPLHLAVFTETAPEAGAGLGRRTMPETLAYSTVCAIHGLWLAARARNIGVGWVSILAPEEIERLCATPESWRLTAYLCIGRAAFDDDAPELERRGWQRRDPTPWARR